MALRTNDAAVRVNEMLRDGESEAKSAMTTCGGAVGLTEGLEKRCNEIGRNAPAVVGHHQLDAVTAAHEPVGV